MSATPVGSSEGDRSWSIRASSIPLRASSANGSSPTAPTMCTCAPRRDAATAWLAPLPPGKRSKVASVTVSPGCGNRSHRATRSRLMLPTTVRETLGGKRAQVVDRAVQEILAQVEEAGPERLAIGHRGEAGRRGQAFERAHENGELEVGVRDTGGRGTDSGPAQDRLPLHDLPGPWLAVPGAALGLVGLELDEEAPQRPLQPGERGLRSLGRPPERGFPLGCGARLRLSLRPALEQAAKCKRRDLARGQRTDEPVGGRVGHAIGAHEARPAVAVGLAHIFLY